MAVLSCGTLQQTFTAFRRKEALILSGETNKVFFSAHLKADYPVFFRRVSSVLGQYGIVVGLLEDTADYWCRDYMPIQVGEDRFVKYKYSPDYLDHPASRCYVTIKPLTSLT